MVFGPDLSDVFARYNNNRADVLRQILEPSLVISNRYQELPIRIEEWMTRFWASS